MSYFHVFLEKDHLSFSIQRKNIIFSVKKKNHLSRSYKKDHVPMRFFWKDHLFRTREENTIFPCIFMRNIKEKDHIFGKKKYHLS